jgi:hypothetical protein
MIKVDAIHDFIVHDVGFLGSGRAGGDAKCNEPRHRNSNCHLKSFGYLTLSR